MAHDDHSGTDIAAASSDAHDPLVSPGTALVVADPFEKPGFPPHRPPETGTNPQREKRAQRPVTVLFYLSILGSVWAIAAYMLFPIETNDMASVRTNNLLIGLGATLALLAVGFGVVHWGKALMADVELVDERHAVGGTEKNKVAAPHIFSNAKPQSLFTRRTMIRRSLFGALIAFPLPAVVLFRGFAPQDK